MKFLTISFFFLNTLISVSQINMDWSDVTYKPIVLKEFKMDQKIIAYDYGKNAMIYLDYHTVRDTCFLRSQEPWKKAEYKLLLNYIDSLSNKTDTIFINDINSTLDDITYDLLGRAKAKIFDKKDKIYAEKIKYRVEKYGLYAYCFFYFQDYKPFFSVMVASGIAENNQHFSDPDELMKLYSKLREIGK